MRDHGLLVEAERGRFSFGDRVERALEREEHDGVLDATGGGAGVSRAAHGPTVVCLHAIGHGAGDFARLAAALRGRHRVLALDWPGQGWSDADLRTLAPTVTCPVLFTWAVRDRFIQLRRNLPAIQTFPNARVVELHAGHAPQLEMPEAFEREVAQLLAALPS